MTWGGGGVGGGGGGAYKGKGSVIRSGAPPPVSEGMEVVGDWNQEIEGRSQTFVGVLVIRSRLSLIRSLCCGGCYGPSRSFQLGGRPRTSQSSYQTDSKPMRELYAATITYTPVTTKLYNTPYDQGTLIET